MASEVLEEIRRETPLLHLDELNVLDCFDDYLRRNQRLPLCAEIEKGRALPTHAIITKYSDCKTIKEFYFKYYSPLVATDLRSKTEARIKEYINSRVTKAEALEIALLFAVSIEERRLISDILEEYLDEDFSLTDWTRKRVEDCLLEFYRVFSRMPQFADVKDNKYRGTGVFFEETQSYLKLPSPPTLNEFTYLTCTQISDYYTVFGQLPSLGYALLVHGIKSLDDVNGLVRRFKEWYMQEKPTCANHYRMHSPKDFPPYSAFASIFGLTEKNQWSDLVEKLDLPLYISKRDIALRKAPPEPIINTITNRFDGIPLECYEPSALFLSEGERIKKQLKEFESRINNDLHKFQNSIR